MASLLSLASLIGVALALSACHDRALESPPSAAAPNDKLTIELRQELAALKEKVETLEAQLYSLEEEEARVWTDGPHAGIARTTYGAMWVSPTHVRSHLDGYAVTLRIGNPLAADFPDANLTVYWRLPNGEPTGKEVPINTTLREGSFTDVEVILTPAQPEGIKELNVKVDLGSIRLRVPSKR
jgi:hypothetical protein